MRVQWVKEGQSIEPILIVPTSCAGASAVRGKVLSMTVPPAAAAACPGALARVRSLIESDALGTLVDNRGVDPRAAAPPPAPPPERSRISMIALIAAAIVAAAIAIAAVKRRR